MSASTSSPSLELAAVEDDDALILPTPPSDEQKWAYFGPQRRWVAIACAVMIWPIVIAQFRYATRVPGKEMFLISAFLVATTGALFAFSGTRRRRMDRDEHMALVASYQPDVWPSVDVLLPTAGERLEVLLNAYDAMATLDWPGELNVYVLDDSARDEVRHLAEQRGFTYRTRPNPGYLKKAGNLKYGYSQSNGDLIVVFDADFAPRADFVRELAPYFADPKVGIVQSPQFFDSTRDMNWLQRGAGTTQEFFYRWVQPSRDAIGAPICVGTNAIYRREALEAAEGFAQVGHSEDVHTGVKCMRVGYEVRYVPVNVAKGLCPDDLDQFVNQQYRWCCGSMSLLRERNFHALKLGWRRKLCFFSGFMYYIGTGILVFMAPFPAILLLWMHPGLVQLRNYIFIVPVVAFGWILMPRMLYARWGPEVFRVQIAYSYAHSLAIWHTIRGRTAAWVATGTVTKGTPLATKVRRLINVWVPTTQVLLWGGLLATIGRTDDHSYLLIALPLMTLSSIVQLPLLFHIDNLPNLAVAARRLLRPRMPSDVFSAMQTLALDGVRAVAPTSIIVAASLGLVVSVAGWTVNKVDNLTHALPAQALAEIRAGKMPDSLGASKGAARTHAVVNDAAASTPVADTEARSAVGQPTGKPTKQQTPPPCVTSTVNPSRAVVDTTIDGDHYYAGLTQSITFCAAEGSAPIVTSASASPSIQDTFLVRIHLDSISTRTEAGGCQVISGPCVRVITDASGHAGTAAKTVASGSAEVVTEIGDRGQTVTTLSMNGG
jgi:cellulose synthase (UDP-forming)